MQLIYTSCATRSEAEKISLSLIEKDLAACCNIIEGVTSFYKWEGEIKEGREVVILIKTTTEAAKKVETHIEKLHSYDVPCVFSIKTEKCSKKFLKWVELSVKLDY